MRNVILFTLISFVLSGFSIAWAQEEAPLSTESDEISSETDETEAATLEDTSEDVAEADMGAALGMTVLGAASIAGSVVYFMGASADDTLSTDYIESDPGYHQYLSDRSDRHRTLAITLSSVGTALLGTAAYFWLDYARDDAPDSADDTATYIGPQWTEGVLGLEFSGQF